MKIKLIGFALSIVICCLALCGCVTFPDEVVVDIRLATDTEIAQKDGFMYYFDEYALNEGHDIILSFGKDVTDFKFWVIDDAEGIYFKDCIYSLDKVGANEKIFISTYINDATINRGFSYKYNGKTEYLYIDYDMSGEQESSVGAVGSFEYTVDEEEK